MECQHEPVAADTVVGLMGLVPGAVVVDCCVGFGGHARRLLAEIAPGGFLLGTDLDESALERADALLRPCGVRYELVRANYTQVPTLLAERGIHGAQGLLLDLGVCSQHFDRAERGFSVWHDAPLDMRMDRSQPLTAADIVNTWPGDTLAQLFRDYGDERQAAAIARAIVERRRASPILTTRQLAETVEHVKGRSRQRIHAGTKVFMAVRMQVNLEIENLVEILRSAPDVLAPGGCCVVISYHSKEDRLVKAAFREGLQCGTYSDVTRKPIVPSPAEIAANPRSRSAKLRRAVRSASPEEPKP